MDITDRIKLLPGDCMDALPTLAENSIDSCVTDPPYHLVSIVKRFATVSAKDLEVARANPHRRTSSGFMGKQWDGGTIAQSVELWRQVYRVLKPGAHLVAFGGTRTYHRMACAIEDAGFEIRDCIQWLYGSGFPKSHDVSKGIDRRGGVSVNWFGPWLRRWREEKQVTQKQIAALFPSKTGGLTGCVANWELGLNLPTNEQFNLICKSFGFPFASMQEAEREIIGRGESGKTSLFGGLAGTEGEYGHDISAPATDAARQWEGWGTALKPACEPIVLARKPLSEKTVAANVLKWGTGAINIDGCRVNWQGDADVAAATAARFAKFRANGSATQSVSIGKESRGGVNNYHPLTGRWPANIVHDGSDEVLAGFPESDHARGNTAPTKRQQSAGVWADNGSPYGIGPDGPIDAGDTGSAARFFYTAKADSDDRIGSKHPTVKPLDLMQYLVRLVTPKGGTVLDPFAGTGTTGEAAFREGMKAVLIEREEEYLKDIQRRMELCMAGPVERQYASIKAKLEGKPRDDGPLFGGTDDWDSMWQRPFDKPELL